MSIPNYKDHDPIGNLLLYLNSRMTLTEVFNPAILPMLGSKFLKEKLEVTEPGKVLIKAYWLDDCYGYSYKMLPDKNNLLVKKIKQIYPPKTILLEPVGFFKNEPGKSFKAIVKGGNIVPFWQQDFASLKLVAPEAEALANCILAENGEQDEVRDDILDLKGDLRYFKMIDKLGIKVLQSFSQKDLAPFLGYTPGYLNHLISNDGRAKEEGF